MVIGLTCALLLVVAMFLWLAGDNASLRRQREELSDSLHIAEKMLREFAAERDKFKAERNVAERDLSLLWYAPKTTIAARKVPRKKKQR